MRARIKENIGKESKEVFGKVETILYLRKAPCGTNVYLENKSEREFLFQIEFYIDTIKDLN